MTSNFVMAAGGLGNQFFQVAVAMNSNATQVEMIDVLGNVRKNYAQNADISEFNFDLPVNWNYKPRNLPLLQRVTSLLLRQSVKSKAISTLILQSSPSRFLIKCYYCLALKHWLNPILATENGYFDFKPRPEGNLFVGYFQSNYWIFQNNTLERLRKVELKDNSVIAELLNQKKSVTALCLHIRLGDYRKEANFGILSSRYYEESLEYVLSATDFDEIWLFSDEPLSAIEKIPERFRKIVWVVPNLSAAQTLELMRHGSIYIIANSSFSWWGAMLSKCPNPTVIAPDKWFKNLDDPALLIPQSWIRSTSHFEP
jgi:hypothetical protein